MPAASCPSRAATSAYRIAVLLPGRPGDEVVRLLSVYDVGLIYRDDEAFKEEWP